MDKLVFTALGAATSQEFNRIQLTNDLANLSTTGYKRASITTTSPAYLNGPGLPTRFQPVVSIGVENISLTSGPVTYTGNSMDVALNEQTVLGVQTEDGKIAFTRRGDLRVNSTGLITNGDGHVVMGEGAPMTVPQGFSIDISPDGSVYATNPDDSGAAPTVVGKLMLRDASLTQLVRRVDGLYQAQNTDGQGGDFVTGPNPVSLSTGALEGSNVNPVEVMVSLLDLYRSFEMQMKMIKNSEEIDQDGTRMISLR
jgi:flagellar basal-body rod protein FlgF